MLISWEEFRPFCCFSVGSEIKPALHIYFFSFLSSLPPQKTTMFRPFLARAIPTQTIAKRALSTGIPKVPHTDFFFDINTSRQLFFRSRQTDTGNCIISLWSGPHRQMPCTFQLIISGVSEQHEPKAANFRLQLLFLSFYSPMMTTVSTNITTCSENSILFVYNAFYLLCAQPC